LRIPSYLSCVARPDLKKKKRKKLQKIEQGAVACNPSCSGGRYKKDQRFEANPRQIALKTVSQNIPNTKQGW
jgi:hypothetical protein